MYYHRYLFNISYRLGYSIYIMLLINIYSSLTSVISVYINYCNLSLHVNLLFKTTHLCCECTNEVIRMYKKI